VQQKVEATAAHQHLPPAAALLLLRWLRLAIIT
jgi:hypothetical protein